jgi:transcriptional regulator with XRE-family HTH domain
MASTNRLKRLRKAQGWSREQLAAHIPSDYGSRRGSIDSRRIRRWELGESSIPEKRWTELADLFGVSIAHLLGLDNDSDGDDGVRVAA